MYVLLVVIVTVWQDPDDRVGDRVARDPTQQDKEQGEHNRRQREGAPLGPVRPAAHDPIVFIFGGGTRSDRKRAVVLRETTSVESPLRATLNTYWSFVRTVCLPTPRLLRNPPQVHEHLVSGS